MMPMWWLSFVDPKGPEGRKFLGVCVVRAADIEEAMAKAWRLGINPGGEVQGYRCPDGSIPDDCINRLINRNELIERRLVKV